MVPPRWGGCDRRRHGEAERAVRDGVVGRRVGKSSCCRGVVHSRIGETGIGQGGEGSKRSF